MAWVTRKVVSADMKTEVEARGNHLYQSWDYGQRNEADDVYTGSNAAYAIGPSSGLGIDLTPLTWTSLRAGYWFKTEGWISEGAFVFFVGYDIHDLNTYYTIYVTVDFDELRLKLVQYEQGTGIATALDTSDNIEALLGHINEWRHVSLYFNNSTGYIEFWLNGESLLSGTLTGSVEDTKYFYAAQANWLGDTGGYIFVDDLYFDYSTSSEVADTPPARKYHPAWPQSAGSYTQWTPDSGNNWERVDEQTAPDDDSSYVSTGSNGDIDMYHYSLLVGLYAHASPDSAIVQAYCRTSPIEGIGNLKMKARLSGTDATADTQRVFREQKNYSIGSRVFWDWCVVTGYFDTRPGLGGEWTVTDFNSAEFGYESDNII